MNSKSQKLKTEETVQDETLSFCGIIMPIADMVGYDAGHWSRVRDILDEAIKEAGYMQQGSMHIALLPLLQLSAQFVDR